MCARTGFGYEGDETWPQLQSPVEVMEELARIKLNGAVMPSSNYPLVVADTAVWLDGELLGKFIDTDDAARDATGLSGSIHKRAVFSRGH